MAKKITPQRNSYTNPVNSGLVDFLSHYKEDKIKKCLESLVSLFEVYRDARRARADRCYDFYHIYRMYDPEYEKYPAHRHTYYNPMGFETVETIVPRLVEAFYGTTPLYIADPSNGQDVVTAKVATEFLENCNYRMNRYATITNTMRQMCIMGDAFEKLVYISTRDYEGSMWLNKDWFDMYCDPYARDMRSCRGLFDRTMMHIDELNELADRGVLKGIDKIKPNSGYKHFTQLDKARAVGMGRSVTDTEMENDYHEVLEYWGLYTDKDTKERFAIVAVIVDRQHLVRMEENPYMLYDERGEHWYAVLPYTKYTDVPDPNQFYGIGEIEVIEHYQHEANDLSNAVMDAVDYQVSPIFQIVHNNLWDKDVPIIFAPGNIIEVREPDALRPVMKETAGWMTGVQTKAEIRQDARDATGIHQSITGAEGSTRKTATESYMKHEEANSRIKMKIMINGRCALADAGNMQFAMERQYTDAETVLRVTGPQGQQAWINITPTDLRFSGKFKLKSEGISGLRAVLAQQRMTFAEVVANPIMAQFVNWPELIRKIGDSLEIDMENMIVNPQQAAMGGGGMPGGAPQPGADELRLQNGAMGSTTPPGVIPPRINEQSQAGAALAGVG